MNKKFNILCLVWLIAIYGCSNLSNATLEKKNDIPVKFLVKTKDAKLQIKQGIGETQEFKIFQERQNGNWSDSNDSIRTYNLDSGQKIRIKGKSIEIYRNDGKEIAKNNKIIRKIDENMNCPSEGFIDIVTKGLYFTIEQQNCSGWHFITEYITFKYLEIDKMFLLHKFSFLYMDRRYPDQETLEEVYTIKDFGKVYFNKVSVDSLYEYKYSH